MEPTDDSSMQDESVSHAPHPLRLPGFITDEDIGLGDVIKRVTSSFGINPCGGCDQRAARLNQWIVFRGKHTK